ncbi:MAG: hypothetical protein MZW92_80390 [Comamonadaceae bacterium]|nr:hypothetical protein [Comamonadaceae bacterium]
MAGGGYRSEPEFQRYLQAKAEKMRSPRREDRTLGIGPIRREAKTRHRPA